LPGIATVLRSPVADAMIGMIRSAARLKDFSMAEADELIKYAVRRSLLGNDEGERVLAEVAAAEQKRQDRIAERHQRETEKKAAAAPKVPVAKAAPAAKAPPKPPAPKAKPVKAVKVAKPAAKVAAKKPAAKAKKR
jgi:hypothetical protein